MIQGTVCKGMGRAQKAFTPERIREVERLFGVRPYPGTLNVRVPSLAAAVASLGSPEALTEHETRIGPLRWWRAQLLLAGPNVLDVLVVRGEKSNAPYLEIVSPKRLRSVLCDGDSVRLIPRAPSSSAAPSASGKMSGVWRP